MKLPTEITVKVTVAVCVRFPFPVFTVPVIVIGYVPGVVVEATENVTVAEDPETLDGLREVALNPTVTPDGCPLAVRVTFASAGPVGSPLFVIVKAPLLPCATETEAGDAERLKLPTAIGTVIEELPLLFVPVIVIS